MTNEELQRVMEFIIKQQESFAENMEKAEERMSQLEGAFVGIFNIVSETVKNQRDLVESQKLLAEAQRGLAEAQKHTDERLNALITVVERFISERRNGQSEN